VRTLRTLAALAALATLGTPGCAAQKIRERVAYYDIFGATPSELRDEMDRVGPVDGKGKRAIATTWWNVRWVYRVKDSGTDSCELSSFGVGLDVATTLPRWQPDSDASKELRKQWGEFAARVKLHEDGHKQIGEAAAAEIERRVRAVDERQSCEEFKAAIEKVAKKTLTEYRRKDVQYDQETQHGLTQGATFPGHVVSVVSLPVQVVEAPRKQVLLVSSPLLRPHKILGVVRVDAHAVTDGDGVVSADTIKLLEDKAAQTYGPEQVDAIMNVLTQMDFGGHVQTTGVAVHFE
jgi:predicted secreted Zn-dependent protease